MSESAPKQETSPSRTQIEDLRLWVGGQESDIKGNRNELVALAMSVKPAVMLYAKVDEQQEAQLLEKLGAMNVDATVFRKKIVINPEALGQRLQDEPEFAQAVGWNKDISIVQNLEQAFTDNEDVFTIDDGKVGFILGYPRTAVENHLKKQEILKKGIPSPQQLIMEAPPENWPTEIKLTLAEAKTALSAIFANSKNVPAQETETAKTTTMIKYKNFLFDVYVNGVGTTEDEAFCLLSYTRRNITDNDGNIYFTFGVDEGQENAPDIIALEEKVHQAIGNLQ